MEKKKEFKKDFGNTSKHGYTREYMKVYCAWLHSLSKKDRAKMETYNDRRKTKKQLRKERKQKREAKRARQLTRKINYDRIASSKATNT